MPQMNMVQAINDALRIAMRRGPARRRAGRRRRQGRRRLSRDRRALRRVRRRPRDRHAAQRGRHRRRRDRHGALRPGAGRRDPVRRLHLARLRPDRQRAREVPLPFGRRVPGEDRDPHAGRRRHPRRALPLAAPRERVHPRAGLKVVCPSNPYDAKGLLLASIRDPDPVIFFEPKRVYRAAKGEVPEGEYMVPLESASIVRKGHHVDRARVRRDALRGARRRAEGSGEGRRGRGHRPSDALARGHRRPSSTA